VYLKRLVVGAVSMRTVLSADARVRDIVTGLYLRSAVSENCYETLF
jgi:hypothetical protein